MHRQSILARAGVIPRPGRRLEAITAIVVLVSGAGFIVPSAGSQSAGPVPVGPPGRAADTFPARAWLTAVATPSQTPVASIQNEPSPTPTAYPPTLVSPRQPARPELEAHPRAAPRTPRPSPHPSAAPRSPSPGPTSPAPTHAETIGLMPHVANGLVTNEFAYWNRGTPSRVESSAWEMDSGSLFASNGVGWTGVPDAVAPNATSSNGNDSAVFRLNTKRRDFRDVLVSFDLINEGFVTTSRTPAVAWDGVHVWLRYQSQYNLYYASVNRRDGATAIKKKVAGGSSNGGTYYTLATGSNRFAPNMWQRIGASIRTNSSGTVTIQVFADGKLILSAEDNGSVGGPPILASGAVGIRGDNCNFRFRNFSVGSPEALG